MTDRRCECYRCLTERDERIGEWPVTMVRMILCPHCGCKRCPQATDHRFACTDSNEPGQPGSRYTRAAATELAIYKRCAALLREREALPWWAAIRYHRLTLRMRELLADAKEGQES